MGRISSRLSARLMPPSAELARNPERHSLLSDDEVDLNAGRTTPYTDPALRDPDTLGAGVGAR